MADEGPISFVLDLDTDQFKEGAQGALGIIQKLGDPESLGGLVTALEGTVEVLGAVAIAAGAFKLALDMTIEGEEIQRIQTQFEMLAKQAGINGEALKNGMEQAAGGLISTTDLLQLANKALVTMGADASQLPALLELARKASLVMGGDVKSNFEAISMAVETGNQKMLKRLGLQVDVTQAEQKFAQQIGITAGELSQEGKNHAILLAVLEKSKTAYANINTDQSRTVDLLTQTKVAFSEVGETISLVFSKTIGPTIKLMVKDFADFAGVVKQAALRVFGTDAEKAAIQAKALSGQIASTTSQIRFYKDILAKSGDANQIASATKALEFQESQLKKLTDQLNQVKGKQDEVTKDAVKGSQTATAADDAAAKKRFGNQQKIATDEDKFQKQIDAIHKKTETELEKNINSVDEIDKAVTNQKNARAQVSAETIKGYQDSVALNQTQKDKLIAAEKERFYAQEANEAKNDIKLKEQLNADYLANSKTMWDGISRAAHTMATTADKDLRDMAKIGTQSVSALTSTSVAGFTAIGTAIAQNGNIAQAAAQAMEKAFLSTLGKMAIEHGAYYISKGIGDLAALNPAGAVELSAGGALVALGGALSAYGGGSSSVSTGGGAAASSSATSASPAPASGGSTTTSTSALQSQQQVQRTVSINIAGHYLNSQESQRTLMEIMRNETDATGFTYNKIGV